jgi:catechol 2,3-dioxygenase-like lactoylglutathione lyase family enzyme
MSTVRVTDLRYVAITTPEFEAERRFFGGDWGLREVAAEGDVAYFAAEGSSKKYVLRVRRAEVASTEMIGLAVGSRADVDAMHQQLVAAGVQIVAAPHELTSPGGGYGVRFFDPDGRTVEVSSDVEPGPKRELARGESIPVGLSHVVFHAPDLAKTIGFYEAMLGFRVSDWLGDIMCFVRCNSWHHRLAFLPGPPALNHIAFSMTDHNEMLRGVARLRRASVDVKWGPGRHTAGNNTFSYFISPGGHVVEYTAELEEIDEDTWTPTVYPMTPEVTDQWGIGVGGPMELPKPRPDASLWKVPA